VIFWGEKMVDIGQLDASTKSFLRLVDQEAGENDDIRKDDFDPDDIDVEKEREILQGIQSYESSTQYVNTFREKHNTGPKGVIADYNEWRERVILENREKAARQFAELEKKALRSKYEKVEKPTEEEEDDLDDSDDDFFANWRRKQAEQLINSIPVFGELREISVNEFVSSVDNEHAQVPVVIHLYENEVYACVLLNEYLRRLAPQHPRVKFLKIVASHAQKTWQRNALPTLLVYRGGELVHNLVRVTDQFPTAEAFTPSDVEDLLARKGILLKKATTEDDE